MQTIYHALISLFLLIVTQLPARASVADTLAGSNVGTSPYSLAADTIPLTWEQHARMQLDSLLLSELFDTSQLGLMVYDLDSDTVFYSVGERQLLRPASTQKIITAVSALDRLGGFYRFKTELFRTGEIVDSTLYGDVYCVGGFDPRFNTDDLRAFVNSLRKAGIDTIQGNLYADRSMKDTLLLGEGWCWDDKNPVLSPLVFNRRDVFMERFLQEMTDAGIVLKGYSGLNRLPDDALHLTSRYHTIDQILMKMMKESDNLYAEAMFYQIASASGNRPASARNARSEITKVLRTAGIKDGNFKIADGSGLSLYNYVTAETEAMLLRYAYHHDHIYHHLQPSLPVAGIDGTLRDRMKNTAAQGKVFAKTGTVTGVSSLAGYLVAGNGRRMCFAIINQGVLKSSLAKAFQDRVCIVLCTP